MMKKYILIMLFTLAGLAGMAQTNEPLPGDAEPLTNQLYLSPSDSTVWAADPFSGLAIKVGTWFKVDSLFKLGYTKAQVDSAITAEKQGLSSVLGIGSDGGNLSVTNINNGNLNGILRVAGGSSNTGTWSNAGQIAIKATGGSAPPDDGQPFFSFHGTNGRRLAHIQAGQGVADDTLRIWNEGTNTAFYTGGNTPQRLRVNENGLFTQRHGQSSFWQRGYKYPVRQNENRKGTFAFIFDDGLYTDTAVVTKFDTIGWKVGFALIAGQLTAFHKQRYLGYQEKGHEILSHSWSNERFDDTSPLTPTAARLDMRNSLDSLKKWGFNVTGWVTPYSQMKAEFLPILKDYYGYGFTTFFGTVNSGNQSSSYHRYDQDVRELWRVSLESSSQSDIIAAITECVSQNGFMVFYGHAYPSTNLSRAKLDAVVDHLKTYVTSQDAEVLLPSDAINKYYIFANNDRLTLLDTIDTKLSKNSGGFVNGIVTTKGGLNIERSTNDSRVEINMEGGTGSLKARNNASPVFPRVDIISINNAGTETTVAQIRTTGITTSQYHLSALNTPPASATATGTAGEIRFGTDGRIYICTATNTWIRSEPLTTWP